MEVTVERKGPCEALVQFTVPREEFEAQVRKGLQHAAKHVRMKGFRPGKVPAHMLEKHFGDRVRRDAREHFVNLAYRKAVEDNELRPAAHPRIDIDAVEADDGGALGHEFAVQLRPDFELGDYKGLEVRGPSTEVNDDEVEQTIEDLRRQRATPQPVGDEGLPDDGMAICRVAFVHEGEEVLAREGVRLSPSMPVAGVDPERFREALGGAQGGDVRELEAALPDDVEREELRGQQGTLRLEVKQAMRIVPASDADLFKLFGVEEEGALKAKVAEEIGRMKAERESSRIENELLEQLIEMHPMELPDSLVEQQVEARMRTAREPYEQQGMAPEDIERQLGDQRTAAYEASKRAMTAFFLIEEIAKAERLLVQEEDMLGELHQIAVRNDASFDEVRDYYRKEGLFDQLAVELLERKVRGFLRENAQLASSP